MKLKLEADKPTVKKTIVVYSGRFQPFHKGHYIAYQKLVSKFGRDNVYIATSNITDDTKSPFTFEEKKKIATKLFGIPSDKFIQIKNPYAPKEILDKYDGKTTQYIAAVGEKDATRLAGKYFKPYNGKAGYGYDEIGYVYTIPAEQNPISGTDVRTNFKGADDKKSKNFFKKIYPKFDSEVYQMITHKLNEVGTGFPTGMAGSFDKLNTIDMDDETDDTNIYDPIAEIIKRTITEDDFKKFVSEYLNEQPEEGPTNPIYDKELTYTAKDGQKKKIKVRSALRLPKDHEAHIQAKKLTKGIAQPVKVEPKKQETPPQKGQPVQKGQTQQGKVDGKPTDGGSDTTQQTPPPQTLKGAELKSSAEHSKEKEKVKDSLMGMIKTLDAKDREFISKGEHKPGSEARKTMSSNITSGLKKFGEGIKNWANHKKEMVKGTGEAVWALANGQKIGSTKNKETGKWEYSDEKRKEHIHHLKHFAKDTALIMGSMALGGAGVAAVQAALGGATAGGVASAAGSGAIGVFTHGVGGFGAHLAKDIAKHAALETLGMSATKAAVGGAGLATASVGLLEGVNGNDFVTNVMKKVAKKMETYELSDEQLKQSLIDYKKEKEKGDLGSLFGKMNENISPTKSQNIQHFIEYATKRLKLNENPKVVLLKDNELGGEQPSLGGYSPLTGEIFVVTDGRLTADILRTIAHEMIHRKQDELKLIRKEDDAGKTGSPIENQANALAGVLLRDYGKINKQIYTEDINLDVDKGDTVLMGKFKNKKTTVKDIGTDDYGMPTINGKKAATFRIPKGEKKNPQSVFEMEVASTSEDESDMIICDNCGHDWYKSEGGNAMYICHVCGYDNQPSNKKNESETSFDLDEKLSQSNLDSIEKYADKELDPADIEFTNHFFDRVNDARNGKEISEAELIGFFKRLAKHKKEFLEFLSKYNELVVKDTRSNINIPFVKMANKAIAKTVMRKDDFKTYTHSLVNEELSDLEKQRNALYSKAFKMMPKSPAQMKVRAEIDKLTKQIDKLKNESINEARISPVKKVMNTIFKKNGIKSVTSNATDVRGFSRVSGSGYKYEYDGLVKFYKISSNVVKNLAKQMREAGVIVDFVRDSSIEFDSKELDYDLISLNTESVNESLLVEGGAYGHMNHPFDIQMNLTFGDLKKIINNALDGNLGVVKEKTDGQALAISWKNGRLVAARNKGHLANSGENALDMNALASKFDGRGELSDAYNFAMRDLSSAISALSEKERQSIFKDGSAFCNLEVIYPQNANVIPYGQALLVLHNVVEYDDKGNAIGSVDGAENKLANMIKKVNVNVQSKYTIQGPPITKLPKDEKLSSQKGKFNAMLNALQSRFKLSDNDGVADYHYAWWMKFVNDSKKNLSQLEKEGLARRWAFDDKSFGIKSITDDEAKRWATGVDKDAKDKIMKGNLRKFEDIFLGVGAEVLSFMSSVLTAQPDKALQSIKSSLESSISDIKSGGSESQIKRLEKELARLNAIGGFDKLVPNEGLVFVYKDNVYKLTGTFAPLNQILGIFKFGR